MTLTCQDNYDGDADWFYTEPRDFTILDTKRGRKCCSCGEPIKVGAMVLKFFCHRPAKNEIEERIYGEDHDAVCMPTMYMCEPCGDLALNLKEIGYCIPPGDDMRETIKEYAEMVQGERDENLGWKAAMAGQPIPEGASAYFKHGHSKYGWAHPQKVAA